MHFYRFFINDYMVATRHLTNEEDLCYRRLLDLYYTEETPLANDKQMLSRKIQVEANVIDAILAEYFDLTPEGWISGRALAEITAYRGMCEKRSGAGKSGGRAKAKQKKARAKHLPSTCQANAPISVISNQQSQDTPVVPNGDVEIEVEGIDNEINQVYSSDFLTFWEAFPEKKEKGRAWKTWKSLRHRPSVSDLIEAIRLQAIDRAQAKSKNEFYPEWKNPATWLNGTCWEDGLKYAAKKEKAFAASHPAAWREILIDLYPENFPEGIRTANFPNGFHLLPGSLQQEITVQAAQIAEIRSDIHRNSATEQEAA